MIEDIDGPPMDMRLGAKAADVTRYLAARLDTTIPETVRCALSLLLVAVELSDDQTLAIINDRTGTVETPARPKDIR
jgi:hypothetical protein